MSKDTPQTLNDICELIVDCEHKTAPISDYETGYLSIRTPNIGRGRLILDNVNHVSHDTYLKWSRRAIPQTDDLILAREAPVGNVAIVHSNLTVCLGQRTVLIRPDKKQVDPQYLVYMLNGDDAQGKFHGYSGGATVAHLNMRDIRGLELPELPPRETQQRIAAVLSAYDDLIENNTQRIAALEAAAQALYREWFVEMRFPGHESAEWWDSELGRIPVGWEWAKLSDACNLTMGQSPKSEFYNEHGEGLPFHQGVTNFGFLFPTHQRYCTLEKRIAEEGDILFSVRAPVGRINLADTKLILGRGLAAIQHKQKMQSFTLFQLKHQFQEEDTIGGGTIFKSVTKSDMQNIEFLVPDFNVGSAFEAKAETYVELMGNLLQKNALLREARDLLLPRLISGELSVDDVEMPQ